VPSSVSTTRKSVRSHTSRLVRTSEPRRLRIHSLGRASISPTVRHRYQDVDKSNTDSKKGIQMTTTMQTPTTTTSDEADDHIIRSEN
jgi:hypothetical protein